MEHWLQRECGRRTQQRGGRTAAKNKTDLWNGGFGVNADARLDERTDRWKDGQTAAKNKTDL